MKHGCFVWATFVPFVVGLAGACGDSSSSDANAGSGASGTRSAAGDGGNGGGGGGGAGTGGTMSTGECAPGEVVVSPRELPDGAGPYNYLQYDFDTGALLLQSVDLLYELPDGESEPRVLFDGWAGDWIQLDGDRMVVPNQFLIDDDSSEEVLAEIPRGGDGDPSAVLTIPAEGIGIGFGFFDRQIVGDSVYWIYQTGDGTFDSYRVFEATWDPPGTPVELLQADLRLNDLIVADGHVFVSEAQTDEINPETDQRVIDLASDEVLGDTGLDLFGAEVREAIGDWLVIVPELDMLEDPTMFGAYVVRADGSDKHFLHENFNLTVSPLVDGEAAVAIWELEDTYSIFRFTPDGQLHRVGCVPGGDDSLIAVALGEQYVYISKIDREHMTWVERLPL